MLEAALHTYEMYKEKDIPDEIFFYTVIPLKAANLIFLLTAEELISHNLH